MSQCKAAQRFRKVTAEPDQVFAWFEKTIRTLGVIVRVKGSHFQAKAQCELIQWCLVIRPLWVIPFEALEQLICRSCCQCSHPIIHNNPCAIDLSCLYSIVPRHRCNEHQYSRTSRVISSRAKQGSKGRQP